MKRKKKNITFYIYMRPERVFMTILIFFVVVVNNPIKYACDNLSLNESRVFIDLSD